MHIPSSATTIIIITPSDKRLTMKQYKGIIFNSTTVRGLRGSLEEAVRERHIRTAVVSNHSRAEVGERLSQEGVSVDLVVGGTTFRPA